MGFSSEYTWLPAEVLVLRMPEILYKLCPRVILSSFPSVPSLFMPLINRNLKTSGGEVEKLSHHKIQALPFLPAQDSWDFHGLGLAPCFETSPLQSLLSRLPLSANKQLLHPWLAQLARWLTKEGSLVGIYQALSTFTDARTPAIKSSARYSEVQVQHEGEQQYTEIYHSAG